MTWIIIEKSKHWKTDIWKPKENIKIIFLFYKFKKNGDNNLKKFTYWFSIWKPQMLNTNIKCIFINWNKNVKQLYKHIHNDRCNICINFTAQFFHSLFLDHFYLFFFLIFSLTFFAYNPTDYFFDIPVVTYIYIIYIFYFRNHHLTHRNPKWSHHLLPLFQSYF